MGLLPQIPLHFSSSRTSLSRSYQAVVIQFAAAVLAMATTMWVTHYHVHHNYLESTSYFATTTEHPNQPLSYHIYYAFWSFGTVRMCGHHPSKVSNPPVINGDKLRQTVRGWSKKLFVCTCTIGQVGMDLNYSLYILEFWNSWPSSMATWDINSYARVLHVWMIRTQICSLHQEENLTMGASAIKWTTLDLPSVQWKVIHNYTLTLNFVKKRIIDILNNNMLIHKAKQFMMTITIPRKVYIF